MTRKFNFLLTLSLMVLVSTMAVAQPNATNLSSEDGVMQVSEENKGKYPPRPNDMWEVGLSFGHTALPGDVQVSLPAGFGVGVHVRKALNYALSLRGGYSFHQFSGRNYYRTNPQYLTNVTAANHYVHAYKSSLNNIDLELLVNLSNLKFHKSTSKWGFYAGGGLSYHTWTTNLDVEGTSGQHDFSGLAIPTADNKAELRDAVDAKLDGDYETAAPGSDVFDTNQGIGFVVSGGVSYRINKQINLSLDQKIILSTADNIDGYNATGYGLANDVLGYTSIRLNFNLGKKDQAEPLYWLNPLDGPYDMIEANTDRLDNLGDLLADKDGDGVPDKLDKEQNSPAGAIVNTKGETLDSDGDNVPDYLDDQPFTNPGEAVNAKGVSTKVQPAYVTKDDLNKMEKDRDWVNKAQPVAPVQTNVSAGLSNWFLPMIHFDNASSRIKANYYPQLDHVATVMKKNPSINVVVKGHASSTASVNYNLNLSYKRAKAAINHLVTNYGIDASRLTLRYDGETQPISGTDGKNFMNRRVEVSVKTDGLSSMSSPR